LLRYRVAHRSAAARPGLTQVLGRVGDVHSLGIFVKLSKMLTHSKRSCFIAILIMTELLFALPEFLYFSIQSFLSGYLSLQRAMYLIVLCIGAGVVVAALLWATVAEPLRKKRAGMKERI
jgi:membrane protein required for beta-lactamase induction